MEKILDGVAFILEFDRRLKIEDVIVLILFWPTGDVFCNSFDPGTLSPLLL